MSTLGDYVHLHLENYEKYGTAFARKKQEAFKTSYQAQKRRNQALINSLDNVSQESLNELKQRISHEAQSEEARQITEQLMNYNTALNDIPNQLAQKILSDVPNKFSDSNSGVRTIKNNLNVNADLLNIEKAKILRRRIYDNINTINNNTSQGKPVRDFTIQTLLKNMNEFFNCLGIVNNNLEFLKIKDIKNQNTTAALKNIVDLVSLSELNKATWNGTFGEVLSNMVSDTIYNKAKKDSFNAIKEALQTGATRTSFQITEDMIAPSVQKQFLEKTGINLYQIHSTQDKVDAIIELRTETIDASVKAYTPKGNVITSHLQDVNLITSLLTTESQFANHWLNLHALNSHSADKQLADQELKTHIEYEALVSGNLLKQDAKRANTFIVIDAVNGRVFAKSTKEILQKAEENFILRPIVENITINNKWQRTWEERIANILLSLHSQKISVGYRVYLDK